MAKFILFALFVVLAVTLISADEKASCGRHGDPCVTVADCCEVKQMACNRFANRCQIQITPEELIAQYEKIFDHKQPDFE